MNIFTDDIDTLKKIHNGKSITYIESVTQAHQSPWPQTKSIWHLLGKSELQIWQSQDHAGNLIWHGYNPKTRQSAIRSSEAELIDWIEQIYGG